MLIYRDQYELLSKSFLLKLDQKVFCSFSCYEYLSDKFFVNELFISFILKTKKLRQWLIKNNFYFLDFQLVLYKMTHI